MVSSFSMPKTYGLKPTEWDVIDLNFTFNQNIINNNPLFIVTDLDFSHIGVYNQLYKFYIKVAPFGIKEIENQISSYHVYVDSIDKIIPITNAGIIYKLEESFSALKTNLDNLFDKSSGFYLK
jgi:hypothetical protein